MEFLRILYTVAFVSVMAFAAMADPVRIDSFERMDALAEEVVIAKEVKAVPAFAFAECVNLRSVVFEQGSRCRSIGECAFYRCCSLKEIELPPSLSEIGKYAFAWCESMEKVHLVNVDKIGALAFAYCSSLKDVEFSERLKSVGNNAFSCCTSLEEAVIPSSVSLLESYAFSGCTSLRRAVLPGNPSLLGELIFSGCTSLEEIVEPSAVPPKFDCESFLFDPDETGCYAKCRLFVPANNLLELEPFDFRFSNYGLRMQGLNNFNGDLYYHIGVERNPLHIPFGIIIEGSIPIRSCGSGGAL